MIKQTIENCRWTKKCSNDVGLHMNGQIRKSRRIYRKAKVSTETRRRCTAKHKVFTFFKHTHTHTQSHVSAGWPDAQRSRHGEGARELQLQCRCSLPYFIFTAQHWAEPAHTSRNKHIHAGTCVSREKPLTLESTVASRSKAFNLTLRPSYRKKQEY